MADRAHDEQCFSCPACRYDLSATRDQRGASCPECGGIFTNEELWAASQRSRVRVDRLHLSVFLIPGAAVALCIFLQVGAATLLDVHSREWIPFIVGIMASYMVSVITLLHDDAPVPWLAALPMAMLVAIFNAGVLFAVFVLTMFVVSLFVS